MALTDILRIEKQISVQSRLPLHGLWACGVYEDWTTGGNWCEHYGQRKAMLCAVNMPVSQMQFGDFINYKIWGNIGNHRKRNDSLRHWVHWINKPENLNVFFDPSTCTRQEAEWDDHGEDYPGKFDGPDVWAYVKISEGKHLISLYFYNPDVHQGWKVNGIIKLKSGFRKQAMSQGKSLKEVVLECSAEAESIKFLQ